jgi:hypothetical protein
VMMFNYFTTKIKAFDVGDGQFVERTGGLLFEAGRRG